MYEPPLVTAHRAPPARAGSALDSTRLLVQLWRWRWALLALTAVGAAAGVAVVKLFVPAEYTSRAVVERDAGDGATPMEIARDLATVAESVKIETSLAEVREQLALDTTLELLGRRIDVQVAPSANVLTLSALASSPLAAQSLASSVLRVVLDRRSELEAVAARARLKSLRDSESEARTRLLSARKEYDEFRVKGGFSDVAAERKASIAGAAALRAEQLRARAEAAAELTRAAILGSATRGMPAEVVLSEAEVRPDLRKLLELEGELAAATASLTAKHPRTQALAAEAEAIRRRVSDPKNTQRGERTYSRNPQLELLRQFITSAKAQGEAARQRQSSIAVEATAVENRIAKLTAAEGRASELLGAVLTAESFLAKVTTSAQVAQEAVLRPPTRLRILAAPNAPSAGKIGARLVVAAAIPAGALALGILACLLRALWGLRVRSATELAYWGRGPVITSSTWPRNESSLDDLAADLECALCGAAGTTLLVPAGPQETTLATTLAARLLNVRVIPRARELALLVQHSHDSPVAQLRLPAPSPTIPPIAEATPQEQAGPEAEPALADMLKGYLGPATDAPQADAPTLATEPAVEPVPSACDAAEPAPLAADTEAPPETLTLPVRHAAQMADRVLVLVSSGQHSFLDAAQITSSLGYPQNFGFVLLNTDTSSRLLPGRVGDVPRFWERRRQPTNDANPGAGRD